MSSQSLEAGNSGTGLPVRSAGSRLTGPGDPETSPRGYHGGVTAAAGLVPVARHGPDVSGNGALDICQVLRVRQ